MIRLLQRSFLNPERAQAQRIIVGAGNTAYDGWFSTNEDTLNLLRRADFAAYWEPGTREAFLAEHVWEHLSYEDGCRAAAHCFAFLRPGGRLRLAVPDGLKPDPAYREYVRPGGSGPGADDHKVLYTARTLTDLLEAAGFTCTLLEYWDEDGHFHATDWNPADGQIMRSRRFDSRNQDGVLRYTSLIADGVKP
jgi:predicted SAM-dependent methyltransferase